MLNFKILIVVDVIGSKLPRTASGRRRECNCDGGENFQLALSAPLASKTAADELPPPGGSRVAN